MRPPARTGTTMSERPTCPDCGRPCPPGSPRNLCPRCLMRAGLGGDARSVSRHDGDPVTVDVRPPAASWTRSPSHRPRPPRPAPRHRARRRARPLVRPGSPEMPDARRPLPALRRDRPRRHGRRPQGPRPRPRPRPGRQGPAASSTATTPSWSAGSSRRRRSAASSSTPGSSRSTSWAPSPTAGRTSP